MFASCILRQPWYFLYILKCFWQLGWRLTGVRSTLPECSLKKKMTRPGGWSMAKDATLGGGVRVDLFLVCVGQARHIIAHGSFNSQYVDGGCFTYMDTLALSFLISHT
jgi:hypothetical protein